MANPFKIIVVATCLGFGRAEAGCPELIHFTAQPGTYAPGNFFVINFVLDCPGPGSCGPCTVFFHIGSGCGAQIGWIDVGQLQPGRATDIEAFMIMPQDAPDGTYHICLRPLCFGCNWSCAGCTCDCTEEWLTINSNRIGDITADGAINVGDLLAVINGWGSCGTPCPPSCTADVTGDCTVDVNDLLAVLNNWGGW